MAMIWCRTPSFPSPKIDGDVDQEDDKELEVKKERISKVSSVLKNSPSSVAENLTLPADFTNRAERTFRIKSTVMSELSQILLTENFTSNIKYSLIYGPAVELKPKQIPQQSPNIEEGEPPPPETERRNIPESTISI